MSIEINKMIFDVFPFFNELDILEIRMNVLDEYVDYFIISEAIETFSGLDKPLYFLENLEKFSKFKHKIIYNVIKEKTEPSLHPNQRDVFQKHYHQLPMIKKESHHFLLHLSHAIFYIVKIL